MSKKSFIDGIEVKNPCSESWEEMAGNDVVRFCSHCSKNVNNLSELTRRQAEKLVRKSGGSLCVKYKMEPKTGLPVFAQKINRLAARTGIAAGVLGASLLLADGAYAQGGCRYSDRSVRSDAADQQGSRTAFRLRYRPERRGYSVRARFDH